MRFVRVVEPGLAMFSRFSWKGEVIDGKVKLKPGYNNFHFNNLEPVEHYDGSRFPNTSAACRRIDEISELEFNEKGS